LSGGFLAPNKRKILEAARKLAQKGAKDKALAEYQKLVKLDPRDAKLRLEIGDAHRRWGQVEEAIETYSKVADQYTKEGFDARAVAVYKQILNLDPNRFDSYRPLAELYERMGLTAEAINALQTAADGLHRQGDKREALDLLRKMATIDPTNTTSRIKVAELLRQEEMLEEAVAEYDQVAHEFERQADVESAAKVYRRILEVDADRVQTLVALARNLIARGGAAQAEALAARALDLNDQETDHYELLADVYRSQNKGAELSETYHRLADLYRQRGDEDRARDILQRYVSSDEMAVGSDSGAELGGVPLEKDGFLDSGDVEDELLLDQDMIAPESDVLPPLETADFAVDEADGGEALEEELLLEPIIPDAPQIEPRIDASPSHDQSLDADQLLAEASVYLRYGKCDKAIAHLESILASEPDHRLALEKLGEAHAENGDTAQAVDLFMRAVKRAREQGEDSAVGVLRGRIAALDPSAAASLDPPIPAPAVEPQPDPVAEEFEAPPAEEDEGDSTLDAEIDVEDIDIDIDIDVDLESAAVEAPEVEASPEPPPAELPGDTDAPRELAEDASLDDASLSSASAQQVLDDLEEADFYVQQRLFDEAEAIYKRVLSIAPNHPRALVRLGEVMAARGGDGEALPSLDSEAPAADAEVASSAPTPRPVAADETAPEIGDEIASFEPSGDLAATDDDLAALDLDDDAEDSLAESEIEADTFVEPTQEPAVAAPPPAQPEPSPPTPAAEAATPEPSPPMPAAEAATPEPPLARPEPGPAAPAGGGFDLAAELSDAFDDDARGSSFTGGQTDDGFSAVFEAFKKGVSEALSEGDHDTHYDLGIAYKEMGLLDDAMQEFRVAMQSPSRRTECLHLIGVCALEANQPHMAVEHLSQHLESPDLGSEQKLAGRLELGRAYQALGDVNAARSCFEAVSAMDPQFCGVDELLQNLNSEYTSEIPDDPDDGYESFEDMVVDSAEDSEQSDADSGESFDDLVAEANADVAEPEKSDAGSDAPPAPAPRVPGVPDAPKTKRKKKISFV
jgi:tetratricopeptide (TPR) repeat protein